MCQVDLQGNDSSIIISGCLAVNPELNLKVKLNFAGSGC